MPDKNLTDNEIIKALECCSTYYDVNSCKNCPLDGKCEPNILEQYALDIINRQKAEIEQLAKDKENLAYSFANAVGQKITAKAEAYKECIEKVKEKYPIIENGAYAINPYGLRVFLDNLLKEMVGDNNES